MSHDAEQATNSPMAYNSRLRGGARPRPPRPVDVATLDLRLHSYPILQLTGSEESIIPADGKIGID